jgi:hypothetical protein
MKELVFLLEEQSALAMLTSLLPRLLPIGSITFRLIPFEGKQDLEKQIIHKIRGYQNPQARFIVLRDQDSETDCTKLKQRLLDLCQKSGRGHQCLVRLACTELETFYLADLQAVQDALGLKSLVAHQASKKFRSPDRLGSPKQELKKLTKNLYSPVAGSRVIGEHLQLDNTRSPSFKNLVSGIQRMANQIQETAA